jgi:homospermidine synthase
MAPHRKFASFDGRLVMVGFGSIGQAVLPVLFRHVGVDPAKVIVVTAHADKTGIVQELGVRLQVEPLHEGNYRSVLEPLLGEGDFLLNLSVHVSSVALIRLCWRRGAMYLDACNEPWAGGYSDPSLTASQRSNYALREQALKLRGERQDAPTACLTQGANPGLVSVLLKVALLNMARELQLPLQPPGTRQAWARLAQQLGIKAIHVAERDTQVAAQRKRPGEFVNTWSVDGFVDEGLQPAELGWGSHEKHWPADAQRHGFGSDAAIYLERPGFATKVRSWTPLQGPFHGFLITHAESISIADHLTLQGDHGALAYRPTVHYAYHPCDDAVLSIHEMAGRNWKVQERKRILQADIVQGRDELGVLLMGNARGVYWFGSRLSNDAARELAPHNSATSLQVVAGIAGAMLWALHHPRAGLVEADDLDPETVMEVAAPYLGELAGVWSDWTPLAGRSPLYPEPVDDGDPWQFLNIRVV